MPFSPDAVPEDRDWLRGRHWVYPVDPDEFLLELDRRGVPLAAFVRVPGAVAMPDQLLDALVARRLVTPARARLLRQARARKQALLGQR